MNLNDLASTTQKLGRNLVFFAKLERLIAALCVLIPLFLIWADGGNIRDSISNYVYMSNGHVFGSLITMAAMLFIVNGAVYINAATIKETKWHGRWYNIVLGLALFGVVLLPHEQYPVPHYISAAVFFVGSAVVIAVFNDQQHRKISRFIAFLTILSLAIYLINKYWFIIPGTGWMSLFWAEWISMVVIAIHYILESLGEIS